MIAKDAKLIAKEWVKKRAADLADLFGAYTVGSINHMGDEEPFPSTSDIDIRIVLERELPGLFERVATGEFREKDLLYRDVILEPQYSSKRGLLGGAKPPGRIMAYEWAVPNAILDPTGHLTRIHHEVSEHFSERTWVLTRCENAKKPYGETSNGSKTRRSSKAT
jgi:hypothetical protein